MREKYRMSKTREFPLAEAEILTEAYFAFYVKCPSLMIDRNQNYSVYSAYAESDNYNDPRNFL